MDNVISTARPRILAMRARDTIRIPMPTRNQCVLVPVLELSDFLALSKVAEARHQRAAGRAEPRVA